MTDSIYTTFTNFTLFTKEMVRTHKESRIILSRLLRFSLSLAMMLTRASSVAVELISSCNSVLFEKEGDVIALVLTNGLAAFAALVEVVLVGLS